MNYRVHIERLVLDGWPAGSVNQELLATSLQDELENLAAPERSGRAARRPVGSPTIRLARQIARSLDAQLGLRRPVTLQTSPAPMAEHAPARARGGGTIAK